MAQISKNYMQRDMHHTSITSNQLSARTARHNVLECPLFSFSAQEDRYIWRPLAVKYLATHVMLQALDRLMCHSMDCATLLLLRSYAEQHFGRYGTTVGRP